MRSPDVLLEVNPHLDPIRPSVWQISMARFQASTRLILPEINAMYNSLSLPSEPYKVLVHIPERYSRLSIHRAKNLLRRDERGLTLLEGLHLVASHRNLIPVNSINLLETETIRNGVRHSLVISFREDGLLEIGIQNAERDDYLKPPFIFAVSCNRS